MQKFQAKGGIATPSISINAASDPAIDIRAAESKMALTVSAETDNVSVYYKSTEDSVVPDNPLTNVPTDGHIYRYIGNVNGRIIVVTEDTRTAFVSYSTDNGATYTKATNVPKLSSPIYDIKYDPKSKAYFFAVYQSIWSTTDFKTWKTKAINGGCQEVVVNDTGVYFDEPGVAIYKTTDGGSNYTKYPAVPTNSHWGFFTNFLGLLTCIDISGNVYRSGDNGASFQKHATIPGTSRQVAQTNSGFIVVTQGASNRQVVIKKTANFTSYTDVQTIDLNSDWYFERMYSDGAIHIVTLGNRSDIYISADDGETWTFVPETNGVLSARYVSKLTTGIVYGDYSKYVFDSKFGKPIVVNNGPVLTIKKDGLYTDHDQPDAVNSLVRKDYVDSQIKELSDKSADTTTLDARYLKLTGGTLTGDTTFGAKLILDSVTPSVDYKVSGVSKFTTSVTAEGLETKAGSDIPLVITNKGPITKVIQGTLPNSLVRKDYVDGIADDLAPKTSLDAYLPLTGGTVTGDVKLQNASLLMANTGQPDYTFSVISNNLSLTYGAVEKISQITSSGIGYQFGIRRINGDMYSVGTNGGFKISRDNGVSWTQVPGIISSDTIYDVFYLNGYYFACGQNNSVYVSTDTISWNRRNTPMVFSPTTYYFRAAYYKGVYVVTSSSAVITSTDTTSWTQRQLVTPGNVNYHAYGVISINDTLFVYGKMANYTDTPLYYKSTDGINYTAVQGHGIKCGIRYIGFDGTDYVAFDFNCGVYKSKDGLTWNKIYDPNINVESWAAYADSNAYVFTTGIGNVSTFRYSIDNGQTWKHRTLEVSKSIGSFCTDDFGSIIVAASDLLYTVRPDRSSVPMIVYSDGVASGTKQAQYPAAFTRKDYVDSLVLDIKTSVYSKADTDSRYLKLSGGEITGNLSIKGKLTINNAPLGYFTDTGDMNDNIQNGYSYIKLAKNGPTAHGVDKSYGAAYVFGDESIGTDKSVNQIYLSQTTPQRMFIRGNIGGTWKNWVKVYHSEDKPTAAELGAAPSGFGLGEAQAPKAPTDDCNKTAVSGFYNVYQETANTPGGTGPSGSMLLDLHWGPGTGGEAQHQLFFSYDKDELAFRRQRAGEWKPWVKVYSEANKPTPEAIGAATPADVAAAGLSLSSVYWAPSRDTMGVGGVPGDGQLLDRAMYPDLFNLVKDGKLPRCTEVEWTTKADKRGCYTLGDGTTNFRVPDYNGKYAGSQSTFLRGDGANAGASGVVQGDAIRNITGKLVADIGNGFGANIYSGISTFGAFTNEPATNQTYILKSATNGTGAGWKNVLLDTSKVVPTAAENRPVNVAGVWVIKAAHKVENVASLDAQELSSKVAEIESKLQDVTGSGTPVLSAHWVQKRDAMWAGFAPADGQLLKRDEYPDAWKAIEAGLVPVTSDAIWLAAASNRGGFSTGDGSTTFRVPDYNGKTAGSLGAAFLRGDGLNSAGTDGVIQGDAIREIEGEFNLIGSSAIPVAQYAGEDPKLTGAFAADGTQGTQFLGGHSSTTNQPRPAAKFKASRVVPTAADNHPVNVTGCWAIKLFSAPQAGTAFQAAKTLERLDAVLATVKPVLGVEWVPQRSSMYAGFAPADGQTLLRAAYPDAWLAVKNKLVPVTTEAIWNSDPRWRGAYTEGDGSTTFRIPDYNGKTTGSLGAAFLRGDGLNSSGFEGAIQGDAIRNITGSTSPVYVAGAKNGSGALSASAYGPTPAKVGAQGADPGENTSINFDASKIVPTAADNHPVNVTGCWAVKLFGAEVNPGLVNVTALQDRITELENKHYFYGHKFTAIEISTNNSVLLKVDSVKASNGITLQANKDSVQVSKAGLYKLSYSYSLEPKGYAQNTTLTLNITGQPADTVAYSYIPANIGTNTVMQPANWTGVCRLNAGDVVSFKVTTVNGTTAATWWTGYFHVEEL